MTHGQQNVKTGQTVFNVVALIRSALSRGLEQGKFSFEQAASK